MGNLFSEVIFYLAPAIYKLSSSSHPLFYKSGITEIHGTFVRLDGFHSCCNTDKVAPCIRQAAQGFHFTVRQPLPWVLSQGGAAHVVAYG